MKELRDFWHWLNETGPYAPPPRNPQTVETADMPALLKRKHGYRKAEVSALAILAVLATSLLIGGGIYLAINLTPTPGVVCSRYHYPQQPPPGCKHLNPPKKGK